MELLTHEETLALIEKAQNGDMDAKEELFIKNEALIKSIVRGFLGRGAEYEDLVSIGSIGMLKAINGYDSSYGVRFSTYAVPMIAGDIKRFLRDDGIIKVSRSLKMSSAKIFRVKEEIKRETGRDATVEEIGKRLQMSAADVVFAMEAAGAPCSLYENAFDDDSKTQLIDTIEDSAGESDIIDKILIKQLMGSLEPDERKLIFLRYFSDKTQAQIAGILGISQVQVSRRLTRTIDKLKSAVK